MKKFFLIILIICILISVKTNCFGISHDFKFVVDTIGIPQYNVYGDEINEDIYYAYNVFAYSNPLNMYSKTNTQRFKVVLEKGKWTENGGIYKGAGTRGEYYVLGTSYSGSLIDNVYFPVDAIPETTPEHWKYISFDGAYSSWFDTSKYKYIEQLDFMKKSNLLFDKLDYINNTADSYNLVEYNISPLTIGLDKTKLNTASTWKTMGVVTAKRINNKGQIRNAIFATKPMAASAGIKSNLNSNSDFVIDENTDYININVNFGAQAINLNEAAKEKHIKEICSVIYIDGKEVSRISSSKTGSITKSISFKVSRKDFANLSNKTIHLEVSSYLYTEFSVDGLMKDQVKKDITIQIKPKKIVPVVPVEKIDLKILEKQDNNFFVLPFIKTNVSSSEKSLGIVETGRNIAVKVDLDHTLDNISQIELFLNERKLECEELVSLDTPEKKSKIIKFKLENNIQNTITSWNYLRNREKNYFEINFDEIGKRIKNPNVLKIITTVNNKNYEKEILFDNIDNYELNMNYIFDKGVLNKEELNKTIKIEDWLKN
jgi:hypothetical protein